MTVLRTRIKVCGITGLDDARSAVAAGADALGFIFVEQSPRHSDPERVREIVRRLPPFVNAVGVFVDADPTHVEEIAHYCRLDLVQLHGSESPDYCRNLSIGVVKAFRVGPGFSASHLVPYVEGVRAFLLDTYHPEMAGGTGKTFDWDLLRGIGAVSRPVILAGGLKPENVVSAIERVRPYAVDVNSGVEWAPGRKDAERIERFVRLVREADSRLS
jgi:phosphoribosylanthranilate isomerase